MAVLIKKPKIGRYTFHGICKKIRELGYLYQNIRIKNQRNLATCFFQGSEKNEVPKHELWDTLYMYIQT